MKIRNGFVANSSTTSFCIYGLEAEEKNLLKELEEYEDLYDRCRSIEKSTELEYECSEYEGDYLGIPWCFIRDDETGKEFKERVENLLKEHFKEVKCYTIEEAYRDG